MTDYTAILNTAAEAAQHAAELVMQYYQRADVMTKGGNAFDVVTDADHASEQLIVSILNRAYPTHRIIGEEGASVGGHAESAEYFWYIDPLDGTVNFSNGVPFFCVSIAMSDRQMRPLVAAVYNPISRELYTAASGHGAHLNGAPLHVSRAASLSESVLASGFPYDKATNPDSNLAEWGAFSPRTRGLRRFGSAALDLCFVAAGRFDGYWETRIKPWDGLAGILCVQEAGGLVSDYKGAQSPLLYGGFEVCASNGRIHSQMLEVISTVRRAAQ
jgi:myo-inositol-1(or 4)-monophosphatase